MIIPPPTAYGLPAKFSTWRQHQAEASIRSIETQKRFSTIVAPTGFGKSAVAETIARYSGRSAYLTITKALQDQIASEISDRYDIRGKSNYLCSVLLDNGLQPRQSTVDQADAMCEGCDLKDRTCEYYSRHRRARLEQRLITNYAKWMSTDEAQLGEFDVLICDEAHGAPERISARMRAELRAEWIEEFCREKTPEYGRRSVEEWSNWAGRHLRKLEGRLEGAAAAVASGQRARARELRTLRSLVRALGGLQGAGEGWIEDRSGGDGMDRTAFEPVWPRAYGETLFRGVSKIVLLSATIRPKTLDLMGIDPSDVDFAEYPSSFPVDRRPVYSLPNAAIRFGMDPSEIADAVRKVDMVIDYRLDRKGIIHSVSFEWARQIMKYSRHRGRMLFNEPRDQETKQTAEVVERFRAAGPGAVLIGPSYDTGWDFEGRQAEYQIIWKVPLLNRKSSPIADARCAEDPTYDGYQAMQKIVQMTGRPMRSKDDQCETFIVDDSFWNWFWRNNKQFAPRWWADGYKGQSMLVPPPAAL